MIRWLRAPRAAAGLKPTVVLVGLFVCTGPTLAQDTPVELQELSRFGMTARALGMGEAMTGFADDLGALEYNPAGLAWIERYELSSGLSHDMGDYTTSHVSTRTVDRNTTRLEHAGLAIPVDVYPGSLVFAFGYHRQAALEYEVFKEGLVVPVGTSPEGLFELEEFSRRGHVDKWTAGVGWGITRNFSVGGTITYLSGSSEEDLILANYRARSAGGDIDLDLGSPSDPDDRVYRLDTNRYAELNGITGSLGAMFRTENLSVGAELDLPAGLDWEGESYNSLEDWEKIDFDDYVFRDDITLPLSLSGGAAVTLFGVTGAAAVRWTDYTQTDYEGEILAPPSNGTFLRESAYRDVVAFQFGVEARVPGLPVWGRAGYRIEELPYRLIAADTNFEFVAADSTVSDDVSRLYRDYPTAVTGDIEWFSLGAGIRFQETVQLDVAYSHGSWERTTPADYENSTGFYPTVATREDAGIDRIFATLSVRVW